MIICACRTFGDAHEKVKELSNDGYHVLFFSKSRLEENYYPNAVLNLYKEYARKIKDFIDKRIAGEL